MRDAIPRESSQRKWEKNPLEGLQSKDSPCLRGGGIPELRDRFDEISVTVLFFHRLCHQ